MMLCGQVENAPLARGPCHALTAISNMIDSGVYNLLIYVRSGCRIRIGRLGRHWFPRGYYVYTGRAKRGLQKRLDRHWRQEKKHRWHIDYLLHYAKLVGVKKCLTRAEQECLLNSRILRRPGAQVIVEKFGASDCRCISHLVYFRRRPCWLLLSRQMHERKAMRTQQKSVRYVPLHVKP